jgi:hypothetical protein
MSSAQSRAVDAAQTGQLRAPADLVLDFRGPCTLGGTVSVSGTYAGDGNGDRAAFDLNAKLDGCRELTGTLSGDIAWTSVAEGDRFVATMIGGLDWEGNDGSASCDFDLKLEVSSTGISYGGTLCGYDVKTELTIGPRS